MSKSPRRWLADRTKLTAIRARLRERMSAVTDGPTFTRQLEAAYREMWKDYLSNRGLERRAVGCSVAAVAEAAADVCGRHLLESAAESVVQRVDCPGGEPTQQSLHLRPDHLNGIQVRRVRRQIQHA